MNEIHLKEYLKGFRESWTVCMQCGSCYYRGPIVPHNWRELPPFEWSSPQQKCPSFEYFKFRAYTPVGRGNIASLIFDDSNYPLSDDLVNIVYTCTGCGVCSEICKAHDPLTVIWALKEELVRRGAKLPDPLPKVHRNIDNYNNIFGAKESPMVNKEIPRKGKNVLFAGCITRFTQPKLIEVITQTLEKANVHIAWLGDEEKCCGFISGQYGDIQMMGRQAHLNVEALKSAGAQQVIVSCAHCYKTLKYYYPKLVEDFPFDVMHISELYSKLIDEGKLQLRNKMPEKVTYHDPCFLGRHSQIYDEPRKVIESIPGIELVEMERSRKWAWCCGSGAKIVSLCYPEFSTALSIERLLEAKNFADTVITACTSCFSQMNKVITNQKFELKIYDISMVIAKALG